MLPTARAVKFNLYKVPPFVGTIFPEAIFSSVSATVSTVLCLSDYEHFRSKFICFENLFKTWDLVPRHYNKNVHSYYKTVISCI